MEKICNKCKIKKDVSEFYKKKGRGDGLAGYSHCCKNCQKKENYKYKEINKENYKEYNKLYREKNKEKLKDYITNWRVENVDKIQPGRKDYYQNNKELIKIKNYEYCKDRKVKDPFYKLRLGIRSLILVSFRNQFTTKSKKTIEILGCSFEEFKTHLESRFDDKMNWGNQGTYWHMDHIIPISSAETEEDVYRLNHYTNFQPLYWLDNLKKSNKM
jgi:hypothetical protein